jgi:glyoxylate/hydroxypyruvate reductase A
VDCDARCLLAAFVMVGISITPHAAALTEPRTAVKRIAENIERVRRGERPLNLVAFEAGY